MLNRNQLTHFVDSVQSRLRTKDSGTQYRTIWQVLHLDIPLLMGLLALEVFSFFILYSASSQQLDVMVQRMLHIGIAMFVMFVMAQIHPMIYQRWSVWIYGVGVVLLIIVLVMGHISKGAQRWISLGVLHFQPSELMKIALLMAMAWYYAYRDLPPKMKDLLLTVSMILIPVVLTAKQPDLGTAVLLTVSGGCVLLFAGIRWRLVFCVILSGLVVLPILWRFMHDYQRQRILTFLNPERDPLGAGYHIIQSKIAIGSGGIFGKGWLQGTQAHLHFLPEHTTDFIFSVCGEDFGLFGSLILLIIYFYIIIRCFHIAACAQNTYTRLLAGSLTLMFFISVFINIGMVSGILPVVGLPLPLISYGGSSLMTIMASFGILMSIHKHRTLLEQ
jgi:rod shape determining protein RodA